MNILITGGFGYIGGRVAQHLGKIYGDENILLFVKNNKIKPDWVGDKKILSGDVLDISSLEAACKDIDVIIHLAALNEIDSERNPLKALRINGEGTLNLVNAAIANKVRRIIYFSTFHVYGLNSLGGITENTVPLPVHPYAITHHVAEDFIRMVDNKKEIQGVILRLSNGFGYPAHPRVNRWSLVVNNLCLQAVLTNKIILKSSGKQYRDFITLTDVSRCVEHFISVDRSKLDNENRIYNLGGEFSISILNMAKLIEERCGKTLNIVPEIIVGKDTNPKLEKPVHYNIDKIKKIGFRLVSNINEEIDRTLVFCKENKELLRCSL